MLKNQSFINMFVWNLVIVGLWHAAVFLACVKLPNSRFSPAKERFSARPWEHGGRWYRDKVKIQLWKDRVPQYIGKDGFSKEHFTDLSIDYIDSFILETCRGEWMHLKNCICVIVTLFINPLLVGIVFSFFILLGNLPFAMIQRYNRFRLQVLRKKRLRDLQSNNVGQVVTA
jgi:glycosyl-4,4'-diaponeurosporenoate acyltransferase